MSRSKKKGKSPGYEYWGKRPISAEKGAIPGRITKTRTHKMERAAARRQTKKLLKEEEGL